MDYLSSNEKDIKMNKISLKNFKKSSPVLANLNLKLEAI